mmetsp:Transcript_60938/g.70767  ORF Transcript_60938/g.70767 Transcript_60938/m.70767 type:complete len:175 (+) Transcript_60938:58-582(+)|eukprot:CAMPEP_0176434724 /NCGR_PEP_ID=MMETSP0127-20121128/16858_1 /TAXON_ID=938130 /ORGANISM="Platyophrya macrostoma, Strain WH" /LENGTH=174 /DNA_ID=CAMNT_0017817537 /DNA_START=47 /DNA_END=571 /DNA_ORIENTATION=-
MSQPPAVPQQQQQQQQQQQAPGEAEMIRNLMVNYIPTTIDELQLRQLFEQYGPIETVKIVCDRETRQSRGYGFVKYRQASSAAVAIQELNGYPILNKRLKVALANHEQHQGGRQNNQQAMANPYAAYAAAATQMNPYAAQMAQQQQMMLQYQQYQQYLMQQAATGAQPTQARHQ